MLTLGFWWGILWRFLATVALLYFVCEIEYKGKQIKKPYRLW